MSEDSLRNYENALRAWPTSPARVPDLPVDHRTPEIDEELTALAAHTRETESTLRTERATGAEKGERYTSTVLTADPEDLLRLDSEIRLSTARVKALETRIQEFTRRRETLTAEKNGIADALEARGIEVGVAEGINAAKFATAHGLGQIFAGLMEIRTAGQELVGLKTGADGYSHGQIEQGLSTMAKLIQRLLRELRLKCEDTDFDGFVKRVKF